MISKYINSGGFAVILLCFLLPLVSIKCQQSDYSLVTFYGYDFVVGKSYKANNNMFDDPFGLKNKSGMKVVIPRKLTAVRKQT